MGEKKIVLFLHFDHIFIDNMKNEILFDNVLPNTDLSSENF